MKEKGCDPFSGSHFLGRTENYPLRKAVVDHNQERIKTGGRCEIRDEIARQLLEWTGGRGADGVKGRYRGVRVRLGLLAISTAFNVLSHELGEAGPPAVRCHELMGFEVSRVAGRGVIMAPGDDVTMKGSSRGNVHGVLIGEKIVTVLKIGET